MLDNANESPNRLRDIRNGQVALIAGQPAVPKSALPLTCPPAKCIRMRVPMWPNCARTGSAPEAPRMFCGPDRQGEGLGPGRGSGAELSGAIWASEGKPSPRAPSQHLQLATNPLSHARMPGPLHLLLHLAPHSSCPRTLAPACSNLTRALCSPIDAIGRRREREQLPDRDCESACGCHGAWRTVLSAAREELSHNVWVPGVPLNCACPKSADV